MKSAVSKGTSWASSSSGKPCSEMRCGAPAGWYDFQWPSLRPVLSVPPLPSEHVPKVGSQWPRAVVSFASLLPEELLPAWWPSDRCNPFVPLLLQGRADMSALVPPQPVVHTPRVISVLDTASLWVLLEVWTDEKLTSQLAQPGVRRWCTKHWHWQYLTSPSSCLCVLLLAYRTAIQGCRGYCSPGGSRKLVFGAKVICSLWVSVTVSVGQD